MIELLIVGGSHDGEQITVDDCVDYVELYEKLGTRYINVTRADHPAPSIRANIEKYRVNRYRGIATLVTL